MLELAGGDELSSEVLLEVPAAEHPLTARVTATANTVTADVRTLLREFILRR